MSYLQVAPVVFIRHNWKESFLVQNNQQLFRERKIAIHFQFGGLDESKYEGAGKTAIKKLKSANQQEALVVAAYQGVDQILIGKTVRGSLDVKNIERDTERFELKTLTLSDVEVLRFSDFPTLFLIQPPYGTIVEWKMGQKAVRAFYEYRKKGSGDKPNGLEFLAPWQLEILCEEYLRDQGLLRYKLFSTGKFMKGFDIVGVDTNGCQVFAQVKHHGNGPDFERFVVAAEGFRGNGEFFYFDDESVIGTFGTHQNIKLIPIQVVFSHFKGKYPEFLNQLVYGFVEAA